MITIFLVSVLSLLFLEAVQMKYRLASHLYGDFFKYQLGPKLSDFLMEERRREKKKSQKQANVTVSDTMTQQPTNE
jgi:hypothetical protein